MGGDLVAAAGLALAIEGALYALFPEAMKRFLERALGRDAAGLRRAGVAATALGVRLVWLVRG